MTPSEKRARTQLKKAKKELKLLQTHLNDATGKLAQQKVRVDAVAEENTHLRNHLTALKKQMGDALVLARMLAAILPVVR